MNYYWTDCPGCHCQLAVNYTASPEKLSGSVRRWSSDRSVNDGCRFEIPAAARLSGGGFVTPCVCGAELQIPARPSAVGGEREPGLRAVLGR